MFVYHFRYALLFIQSILLDASVECTVGDAEFLCRFLAVAAITLKSFLHDMTSYVVEVEAVVFGQSGILVVVYLFGFNILEGIYVLDYPLFLTDRSALAM